MTDRKDITIIDYGLGNLQSICFALDRIGASYELTNDKEKIKAAHRVLLPGVGEASTAMQELTRLDLIDTIRNLEQPVLGICLGMQLLCTHSEEGNTDCLNLIPIQVKQFKPENELKVPHTGWNTIERLKSPLLIDIQEECYLYFVHSYYAERSEHTIAECNYGFNFSAAIAFNNFYGCQFHPEKSGDTGELILRNFIHLS
ncbi:MAG: imidazole glycerol phosphate synthase subunit HisH [Bacteroidales bacterium]